MKIKTGRISNQKHQSRFIFLVLTLFLTLFYTTLIFGATFHIDPTFTGSVRNGTIANPYSSWTQFTITNGNTYLQKRGTTFTTNGNLWINQKSNITIGAYGTGNKPKFISTGNNVKVLDFANSTNIILRDFEVTSTGNALTAIYIASGSSNILVDNCDIHNCEWGIRVVTEGGGTRILNSTIRNIGDDGIYVMYVPDIEIGYCHIYDVNMKWHTDPNQSYSPGDNIQISSTNNLYFHIHNNILDHSSTGNKFCFIAYGVNYSGLIEHNTMIGNAENVTSCLYFHPTTGTVTVRYNTLKDGNYAIYSYVNNLQLHYNKIINNRYGIRVLTNYNLTALNNVFYGNTEFCISSLGNTTITSRNNAFYLSGSAARAYNTGGSVVSNHNNFNTQQSNFINGHSTLASWRSASGNDLNSFVSNPLFVNPAINDFCLQANSPCINTGANVNLINDFFGTAVPQANSPDIGIHEVLSGGSSNLPPTISNQTFSIPENSANGTLVGQVIASDPDPGQTITYSITGGNTSNAFTINASNGLLTVANSQLLNYELVTSFPLIVRVTDNGTGYLWSQATVTVNLLNVNEVPVIANQSFSVLQNATNGTIVGTVVATDPDQSQTLSFSITSGNTNSAFSINSSTGRITVANSAAVVSGSFSLTVRATDNGTPVLWSAATVTITVAGTTNQTPVINNQSFSTIHGSSNGTVVGTVVATDPNAGQTLSFSITGGNTNNVFAIAAATGVITVANTSAMTTGVRNLTVRATDNGSPVMWSQATVAITVNAAANQAPVINNQSFNLTQNAPNGTLVGTVVASDPNAGQSLTYSITGGNTNSAFAINPLNGNLTVNNSSGLTIQAYALTVRVIDNGSPSLWAQATITINVNSGSGNNPLVMLPQSFYKNENGANGSYVGQVIATDPDPVNWLTFSITGGNTDNAFNIQGNTGRLFVNNAVAINYELYQVFYLQVKVINNLGAFKVETMTINIIDVNEAPIVQNQTFSIINNASNGSIVGTVVATDPDQNQTLSFSITSGNTNSAFSINGSTGGITVANSAAIESGSFSLTVRATDNGTPVLLSEATVTITVTGTNNLAPVIYNQSFSVVQNAPNGTLVGTIVATDPNTGQSLTYSIIGGNTNTAFAINSSNGNLTVNNSSAISIQTFALTVRVTDNGTPSLWAQASITINVNSGNGNNPPELLPQSFNKDENGANGSYVGKVIATDPDSGNWLTFSIEGGNTDNAFKIQGNTGRLFVNNAVAINYELYQVFYLQVKVIDNIGAFKVETMTINIIDVNEAPVMLNQNFTVNSNTPNGTVIGQVIATDPDQGQTLSYAIIAGNTNGIFAINLITGALTVVNSTALRNSAVNSFALTITVTDNGSPVLFSNGIATISVLQNRQLEEILVESLTERLNMELTVYPNPSSDGIFNIKSEQILSKNTSLLITDLTGRLVMEESFSDVTIFRIDLSNLPTGVYILNAKNAEKHFNCKLIRQ